MTEAKWLACTDPTVMLKFLRGKASGRKLLLFLTSCCRRFWHLLTDERSRHAVEVAEQEADGLASEEEKEAARNGANQARDDAVAKRQASGYQRPELYALAARAAAWIAVPEDRSKGDEEMEETARALITAGSLISRYVESGFDGAGAWRTICCSIMRDLFGARPFRRAAIDPSYLTWNHATIPKLAQSIYEERAFDRLPILADALEEAGCTNPDILQHCRQPGDHVRGCWVVDLLVNKK
jgi:hypothetical protein